MLLDITQKKFNYILKYFTVGFLTPFDFVNLFWLIFSSFSHSVHSFKLSKHNYINHCTGTDYCFYFKIDFSHFWLFFFNSSVPLENLISPTSCHLFFSWHIQLVVPVSDFFLYILPAMIYEKQDLHWCLTNTILIGTSPAPMSAIPVSF